MSLVSEVTSVEVALLKSRPPVLAIFASGQVNTGGYTNIKLEPIDSSQPVNGVLTLNMVATPPEPSGGPVTQAVETVEAALVWEKDAGLISHVVVNGQCGSVTARVGTAAPLPSPPQMANGITTEIYGEEQTTLAIGEEGSPVTSEWYGEENPANGPVAAAAMTTKAAAPTGDITFTTEIAGEEQHIPWQQYVSRYPVTTEIAGEYNTTTATGEECPMLSGINHEGTTSALEGEERIEPTYCQSLAQGARNPFGKR